MAICLGRPARRLVAFALALACSAGAAASQFYLFPVKEIEGVAHTASPAGGMVDPRFIGKIFGDNPAGQAAQRRVVGQLVASLGAAYPASIIHPRQVFDTRLGGPHAFVDDDARACKQAPSFNVADSYAVVIGITRASIYEVDKGDVVEILIPVTLNLQFIKPNLAKIVYTLSETVYSPFRFSRAEYASGAADAIIAEVVMKNIQTQVDSLVAAARQAFNPKDVVVTLVDRDGTFFVADQGAEAGFVKGEQVEARDAAGRSSIFDVLYVDAGYAVLKPLAGSAAVGDKLHVVIDKPVDDGRKPRLMPVVPSGATQAEVGALAEIFSKDIGFQASFQMSPVDARFAQTKELITRAANCVSWQGIPSMSEASGERKDPPDFFLRFTPAVTPVTKLVGAGGTKTTELFHTLVTAQVVDRFGRVIFSELGDNDYAIEKVNGVGLNVAQAKEISLKNATQKLAANFIAKVRFEPKDYRVAKVDASLLWVEGLHGIALSEKLTFDVLHPLSAMVHGKNAMLNLDVSPGAGELIADGELIGLPYSASNPALPTPRRGDLARIYSSSTPGMTKVRDCAEPPHIGQNNIAEVNYLAPLIRHTVYQSSKFSSHIGDPAFYNDANLLLQQGLFDLQLAAPTIPLCVQPGYVIREEPAQCEGELNCRAAVTMGLQVRLRSNDAVQKSFSTGLRSEFSGFAAAGKHAFYAYKQLSNGLVMQADLKNKLNSN